MTEPTLEENIRQILPTLPLPIQKFFEQRKLGETARLLMERYALHIDHGTILERELMFLLLGLKSPDEFAKTLYAELPVSKQTVLDIINDVNQEVFVPLREEMRKGATTVSQPTRPAVPPVAAPRVNIPPPSAPPPPVAELPKYGSQTSIPVPAREVVLPLNTVIIPANPRMPPRPPEINVSVPINAPLEPAPPKPAPPSSLNRAASDATRSGDRSVQQNGLATPKPLEGNRLLEDHEEPHIEFHREPSRPLNNPRSGLSGERSEGRNVLAPPNLPGQMPPPVPTEPYSADPYREPIE